MRYFDDTYYLADDFIRINRTMYSQVGLSFGLKFLILTFNPEKSNNLKLYGHLAFIAISPGDDYYSIDGGIGLKYIYNNNLSFYLDRRVMLSLPPIAGPTMDYIPNMLFLNVCYKFKLVL